MRFGTDAYGRLRKLRHLPTIARLILYPTSWTSWRDIPRVWKGTLSLSKDFYMYEPTSQTSTKDGITIRKMVRVDYCG